MCRDKFFHEDLQLWSLAPVVGACQFKEYSPARHKTEITQVCVDQCSSRQTQNGCFSKFCSIGEGKISARCGGSRAPMHL